MGAQHVPIAGLFLYVSPGAVGIMEVLVLFGHVY